ncbi:shikimate kinase [Thermostichus vulcanus]|uniref:Shikimate kinase n=1 Tax=Thermostichus vulcanus str. 'Rupite' TaxID=2813851 RepID=A0ABT0C8R9_THEVL|nr:shikimate kinase [Thermostichus vulcanus]MCJ2542099.1 shikimate kinase [Thermostichus vulcanus str. 'Rupite']
MIHPEEAERLQGVNLYLIGMMASGKSTLGVELAAQLGFQFFDTDVLVEQVAGCPIPDLFAKQGEAYFRDLETQVLAQLSSYTRLVIATGGGIVLRPQNWSYLHHGLTIWLDAAPALIWQRLLRDPDQRPLLQTPDPEATLHRFMQQRQPFYAQADVRVSIPSEISPPQLAEQVWQAIRTRLREGIPSKLNTC